MGDDEELFTHEVKVWAVGDLRRALEGVADEFPLRVWIAEEPGGDTADEQVVFGACPWNASQGKPGEDIAPDCFALECEFPPAGTTGGAAMAARKIGERRELARQVRKRLASYLYWMKARGRNEAKAHAALMAAFADLESLIKLHEDAGGG